MTKPRGFEKPAGVKDYLPDTVARLRKLEANVLECMNRWGYEEIITPTLEYYDTVGVASSTSDRKLFKLLDRNGTTLVLRSDMTAPIARVVASTLNSTALPIRLAYHANVFRAMEEEAGRDAEFYQTGVELVGDASADADAEAVALAVACLEAAGVRKFRIALGHVGFLNGLLEETLPGRQEDQQQLKQCLLDRDFVGYRKALGDLRLEPCVQRELEGILRLRGGQEICDQAGKLTRDPVALEAVSHLCEVWEVLKAYGVNEHVLIDLTMIGDFSYYTGMTFEGYAEELGFPVCNGGRYDNLLTQFGRPAPATGFALKTNRILELLAKEGTEVPGRVLILYDAANRVPALQCASDMRGKQGATVETRKWPEGKAPEAISPNEDGTFTWQGDTYADILEFLG
jgi:ATP phosphoribosyltransferase regulatory subunit